MVHRGGVNPSTSQTAMTVYYLIIGIILILGSACMIVWPRAVWFAARGWQYANPKEVQLSVAYMTWLRISGAVGVLMGLALIVYAFQ
jgi:hypothetical protein